MLLGIALAGAQAMMLGLVCACGAVGEEIARSSATAEANRITSEALNLQAEQQRALQEWP